MQGHETPPGVDGDTSRDGAEMPSRVVVDAQQGKTRMIPAAFGGLMTPTHVYFSGEQAFAIHFGQSNGEYSLWTDVRGLDAIIDCCMAAKVSAEIAGAKLGPVPTALEYALARSSF